MVKHCREVYEERCPAVEERNPDSCISRVLTPVALTGGREEGTQGMCGGEKRGGTEIGSFLQIFFFSDLTFIFPASSLSLLSCLFPLLSLLSSPFPRSLSHYLTLAASATFEPSPLQLLTLPPHISSVLCSFPPSISCLSPVIICDSENERETLVLLPI